MKLGFFTVVDRMDRYGGERIENIWEEAKARERERKRERQTKKKKKKNVRYK